MQHRNRHGSSPFDSDEGLRKMTLLEIVPSKEAGELESQLHLFKTYIELKARIEELVATRSPHNSRINNLENDTDNLNMVEFTDDKGELQRLERKIANASR